LSFLVIQGFVSERAFSHRPLRVEEPSELPLFDEAFQDHGVGPEPVVHPDHEAELVRVRLLGEVLRLLERPGDRFLHEGVLPRLQGGHRHRVVGVRARGDDDGVDVVPLQHEPVVGEHLRDGEFLADHLRARPVPVADRDHLGFLDPAEDREMEDLGHPAQTDDAHADFFHFGACDGG
jgi:hypothetical protein